MPRPARRPVTALRGLLLSYAVCSWISPSMTRGRTAGNPAQKGRRILPAAAAAAPAAIPSQNAVHRAQSPEMPQGRAIHLDGSLWQMASIIPWGISSRITGERMDIVNRTAEGTKRSRARRVLTLFPFEFTAASPDTVRGPRSRLCASGCPALSLQGRRCSLSRRPSVSGWPEPLRAPA